MRTPGIHGNLCGVGPTPCKPFKQEPEKRLLKSYDLETVVSRLSAESATAAIRNEEEEFGAEQRTAAVAAIIRQSQDRKDTEILLMCRAERDGDPWSGHMAFPGGRRDHRDESLLHTAVRETFEEVGLDLRAHGTMLTRLPHLEAMAKGRVVGLVVVPFVFVLESTCDIDLSLNHEVAATMWTPLGPLARGEAPATFETRHDGLVWKLPGYRVGERIVWGLTYRMLEALFERLHDPPQAT